MEVWSRIISRLVIGILSILDASSLRTRLFEQREEHEIMWTALDDIARMHKDTPAGIYAEQTLKQIKMRYGK